MSVTSSDRGWAGRGLTTQGRVVGAVILRELHTRFGRQNIGYLWFILEPMLLASGIALAHHFARLPLPAGIQDFPFTVTGYCAYMLFRGNVTRSPALIEANRGLLYHRQVTLFDLTFARCLLEAAAVLCAMLILLSLGAALGWGKLPERPLLLLFAMGLMFWYTFGLAMLVVTVAHYSVTVERLIHPMVYLSIPISGMLTLIEWFPEPARDYLRWIPLTELIEMVRMGQFASLDSPYVNIPYVIAVCAAQSLVGMLSLRIVRRHLDM